MERKVGELYGGKVRVRVCGLLERENRLLLARHEGIGSAGHLWLPPGGGLEFGETAEHCLIREFEEECRIGVEVGPFYHLNELLAPPLHAIEIFYRVFNASDVPVLGHDPEIGIGPAVLTELRWFNAGEILSARPAASMHAVALRWAQEA